MNRKWIMVSVILGVMIVITVIYGKVESGNTNAPITIEETREKTEATETKKVEEIRISTPGSMNEETDPVVYPKNLSKFTAGTILQKDDVDDSDLWQYFTAVEMEEDDGVFRRINGKSYQKNDDVFLSELRYLKVIHYNFDHQLQVGELIVHKTIASDVLEIFFQLLKQEYEIQSMKLIDDYWTGDGESSDYASIDVNNTSAFCFRQVTGGRSLSNHAFGLAIDLNPQQNPYVRRDSEGKRRWAHTNADDYIQRDTGIKHVITHEDPAYRIFTEYGFEWGGDWENPKDYQHFEKQKISTQFE